MRPRSRRSRSARSRRCSSATTSLIAGMSSRSPRTTRMRLDKAILFRELGYRPHRGQMLVHRSKAKRRVLVAGVRTGKSIAAAHEAVAAALQPCKRSVGWCVGPTLELADKVHREIVIIAAEHLNHRLVELK